MLKTFGTADYSIALESAKDHSKSENVFTYLKSYDYDSETIIVVDQPPFPPYLQVVPSGRLTYVT